MEIIIPIIIWLAWSYICWLIGYIIGWTRAHQYWEHVDNLDGVDGDEL